LVGPTSLFGTERSPACKSKLARAKAAGRIRKTQGNRARQGGGCLRPAPANIKKARHGEQVIAMGKRKAGGTMKKKKKHGWEKNADRGRS